MTFTVVPLKDNYNTSFSIDFKTTGTKNDDAPIFELLMEHKEKVVALLAVNSDSGGGAIIAMLVMSGLILLSFVGVVIYLIIISRKQKSDKVKRLSSNTDNTIKSTPLFMTDNSFISDN
jgi:hypothetical protein